MKSAVFVMLGVLQISRAGDNTTKIVQVESTDRAKINAGGTIRLANSYGDLVMEAWDRPEVEMTVVKWIDHEFKPDQLAGAAEHLKTVRVDLDHSTADEIKISTVAARSRKFGQVTIKYHIYAPRDARLAVDHRSGFILVSGFAGDIDVTSRRGDIVLMLPDLGSYTIDARNKFGIVTPDVEGTTRHKHVTGEQFIRDGQAPAHHMRLRMGFGGITLKELPPEAEAPAFAVPK
jgi:hypothetical protein